MQQIEAPATRAIVEQFVGAIACRDHAALAATLAPDVAFRALTPGRTWEFDSRDDVVEIILGRWFGGERKLHALDHCEIVPIGERMRAGYRFRASTPDGAAVVEQQAYCDIDAKAGTITDIAIVCSGFHTV